VVPRSVLDAYSGAPLLKKLGIKEGSVVALVGAPPGFRKTLGPLPAAVRLRPRPNRSSTLVLWFARSRREVEGKARSLAARSGVAPLWVLWPKKASGIRSDLTQQVVRRACMARGLVDYKICSVDDTWSGLLFRRRPRVPA